MKIEIIKIMLSLTVSLDEFKSFWIKIKIL